MLELFQCQITYAGDAANPLMRQSFTCHVVATSMNDAANADFSSLLPTGASDAQMQSITRIGDAVLVTPGAIPH